MLFNYIKIAFRSILKFKGYATINLLGLALGLAVGILIMLYVFDELSYDKFHANKDRIYRVESLFYKNASGEKDAIATNAWPVGVTLKKDFPEVESVLYAKSGSMLLLNHNDKRLKQRIHFVSPEFLSMFSFPLVKGNPDKALTEPNTAVLTESMAEKLFPGGDALNKNITLADTLQFMVTGILKDIPSNSHIQLDIALSFSSYPLLDKYFTYDEGWGNINVSNYILLKEGTDIETFRAKAENVYTEHASDMLKQWGTEGKVVFTPLSDIYLRATNENRMGSTGSIDRVYLVSAIAAFVILLACINFVNLTTARSVYRAKEVGLRKVVGSTRSILIRQFLSESFVLTCIALLFAVTLAGVLLPIFNQLLDKYYTLNTLVSPAILAGIACLVIVVTFLSGYYPAWVMSGLRPVEVLKGKMQSSARGVQLRRTLVVFQFVISLSLVLGTLIVINQLRFMQQQELGFAKDEIFVVNAARARSVNAEAYETFRNEVRSLAFVDDVTFTNSLPGNPGWLGQVSFPEGKSGDDAISVEYMAVDDHYMQTLGLELIAGERFSKDHAALLKDGLVLNETAVSDFGWASPEEAIGKKITSPSGYPEGEVIGVVKDYHQFGLQQNIGPMVMDFNPNASYMYAIRYKAADTQQLIETLGTLWKKHFPGYDFNYFFLDQDFERQYQTEQKLVNVFGLFSVVTIVIAMIGLLGLVSFMVLSKTKEIGVRKVLGADILQITTLLSKEFIVLVVVANVIAIPLAWLTAARWLENYATRISVNPLVFIIAFIVLLLITLVTISFQTVKAASANPVDSLRSE
ncbi:ABC transporter permease [Ohtaekwangia kribbensis]|jgi:putative ABC transport system permease protein|uniref:ABC transporter permease n=1 Tax=Ohtaekwangia kribbensis TaxID=688913 RepID=A0ABW3KF27_9BACT